MPTEPGANARRLIGGIVVFISRHALEKVRFRAFAVPTEPGANARRLIGGRCLHQPPRVGIRFRAFTVPTEPGANARRLIGGIVVFISRNALASGSEHSPCRQNRVLTLGG